MATSLNHTFYVNGLRTPDCTGIGQLAITDKINNISILLHNSYS